VTTIQHAFSMALLHFVWQGIIVGAFLRAILFLLKRGSPNLRYSTFCAGLALLTTLPIITTCVLYQRTPAPRAALDTSAGNILPMPIVNPAPDQATKRMAAIDVVQAWGIRLWYMGVILAAIRIRLGWNGMSALRQAGEPAGQAVLDTVERLIARMRVDKPVQILVSNLADGPGVAGWIRPVIFLPAAAVTGLSPLQLEAILAHEIAHIRRHDYLVNLLQLGAETLLFYHPVVWWLSARIRLEREYCCDDLAVVCCQDALCYARALATLERLRLSVSSPALGSTDGSLFERIQRLLGEPVRHQGPGRLASVLALTLALACFVVSTRAARGQAAWSQSDLDVNSSVLLTISGAKVTGYTRIAYPPAARSAREQGLVDLQVFLDSRGNVRTAKMTTGRLQTAEWAPLSLQKVVLAAVGDWQFEPGKTNRSAKVAVLFQASPRSGEAFLKAGDFFVRAGLPQLALPRYRTGAEAFPARRLEFLKRELDIYLRQENLAAAKETLRAILDENPADAEARAVRASFLLDEGRAVKEAESELQFALGSKPKSLVAHYNLGRVYALEHDQRRAQLEFEEVLRLQPDNPWALLSSAEILLMKGDYEGAIRLAQPAVGRPPFNVAALVLKASALRGLHRYDEARTLLARAVRHDPDRADAIAEARALDRLQKQN
jgi:beta-lactamase regulating signal transducer with metallopeptidase domain/tetratricopeptide (TPR) repeat protein